MITPGLYPLDSFYEIILYLEKYTKFGKINNIPKIKENSYANTTYFFKLFTF